MPATEAFSAIELATEITMAWLANPNTRTSADDVPRFLHAMRDALASLADEPGDIPSPEIATPEFVGATSERKSLASSEHIISMIDGKPYRTLKRHLTINGLTPDQYRARYGLKSDYPMTAPAYSAKRRALARESGLGQKSTPRSKKKGDAPSPRGGKERTPARKEIPPQPPTQAPTQAKDGQDLPTAKRAHWWSRSKA